jgi:very-short-patch-repair endonuclease
MTRAHKKLSDALRRQGVQHRNEVRLLARNWDYAYVADIYIPQRRIVIEVDGPSHFGRGWRDRIRDIKLRRDLGLRTVRIKNSEVEKNEDRAARKLDQISYYR